MNKDLYCVYMHKNKINGKVYIGSTKHGEDPNLRWRNGKHYGGKFKKDIDKYGWDEFEHYIIQDNLSAEEANKLEKLTIVKFNATDPEYGYNINIVGNHHNEQSLQKINESVSESLKQLYEHGYTNPMQGKHHSEETRQKLKAAFSGRKFINDGKKCITVKPEDLDKYLKLGFVLGRLRKE